MIPDQLISHIQEHSGQAIVSTKRASGGSINQAALIELEDAGPCFLKWNPTTDSDLFVKEVKGLDLLASAGTDLLVPEVIDQGAYDGHIGYLLLEYIEEGSAGSSSAEDFGRELAAQHKVTEERFGLNHDNYIGKLPQSNNWQENWVDFFIQQRMEPQLKMALDSGELSSSTRSLFENMYQQLPDIFPKSPPVCYMEISGRQLLFQHPGKSGDL
ncbi:MAG: fructosamine kinase family protein [Balneolaceae bacterium]|nr:fructosamine kinase family protein [Balneolaceae bacterium]